MSEYSIKFTRYSSANGRDLSAPFHADAEDFAAAYATARIMARAMEMTDPARVYEVAAVVATSYTPNELSQYADTHDIWGDRADADDAPDRCTWTDDGGKRCKKDAGHLAGHNAHSREGS